jgi:hypothetical protein
MLRLRLVLLLLSILATALPAGPAAAAEEDGNLWLHQTFTRDASDKVFLRLEVQERFTNDADRLGQFIARTLVAYRIAQGASIGAGYGYILTDPVGPVEFNEHRFYQELNLRLLTTAGGTTLDSRTRLEQRLFEERGGTDWRVRQFVQLRVPINARNRLVLFTEPFVDLSEGPVQRGGLSVWRNFAGVSIPLGKGVEVVPGYLNQAVFRAGPDRIDHTANINLFVAF